MCVSRWARGSAVRSVPERMCMCVPLSDHGSSACMCVHVREHTCDGDKDEPMCSAKFECSLRVCGYVKANVYIIVRDLGAMLEEGNG